MKKIFALLFLASSITTLANENFIRKISVTGNVERQITPNVATITFEAKSKKETLDKATKDVNNKIENFKKLLSKQNIYFNDFETIHIDSFKSSEYDNDDNFILDFKGIQPQKENPSKNITGYNINIIFLIKNNDFNKIIEILGSNNDELLQSIVKDYDDDDAYILNITESGKTIDKTLNSIFSKFTSLKNKLIANNIDEKNIILGEYLIEKIYEKQNNNQKNYFTVTNEFKITTNNIKQLNNIIDLASENDINITGNINFNISNRDEIESEMYNDAFKQAKNKATSILKSSKMILGTPIIVSEDLSFQNKTNNSINENWTFRTVPLTANYAVASTASATGEISTKNNKINYTPKPITLSQNISIIYEIKESEVK